MSHANRMSKRRARKTCAQAKPRRCESMHRKGGGAMYGKVLKEARQKAGLTQQELAWRMNCTQGAISKYENDRLTMDVATFAKWMRMTHCEHIGAMALFGIDLATWYDVEQ